MQSASKRAPRDFCNRTLCSEVGEQGKQCMGAARRTGQLTSLLVRMLMCRRQQAYDGITARFELPIQSMLQIAWGKDSKRPQMCRTSRDSVG